VQKVIAWAKRIRMLNDVEATTVHGIAENIEALYEWGEFAAELLLSENHYVVPTARLELAQLSPLPPQDSVSTNFTTSALHFNSRLGRCSVTCTDGLFR
jgi:hypothetical protein